MVKQNVICRGACADERGETPAWAVGTPDRIDRSLSEMMRLWPRPGDVWVFGYGALMWQACPTAAGRQAATLTGWHRSYCLRLTTGRGSAHTPGRMLALELGGTTHGIAIRLSPASAEEELRALWIRKLADGRFRPVRVPVGLADGRRVSAITFVAVPEHPHHEADSDVASVAAAVFAAYGPQGVNADDVHRLQAALTENGIADAYVEALAAELRRMSRLAWA